MTLKTNPTQLQTCEVSQLSQGVQLLKMKLMRGFQVRRTPDFSDTYTRTRMRGWHWWRSHHPLLDDVTDLPYLWCTRTRPTTNGGRTIQRAQFCICDFTHFGLIE
jgi:hypothetical protein